ncbi:GNAT family N-acetyltransferase [Cellulosimicrobium cellulans]|uniref:GNAT family N-acetyltransferase n=1 Tax=Cellulosimicrobium cellulans TaxID=1710 RepID=UPI000848B5A7|nr:GNAT family N-acetyltransferase [Cellulosimicrobium cellulans]
MTSIRPARTDDPAEVERLYAVCLRTGASGDDATGLYADPRLLGEVYLGAYLALEPELAFVVDDGGVAAGYVLGARDTVAFEAACERAWWPALRERYPLGSFSEGSRDEALVRHIHAPPVARAGVVAAYPSHLHVDLLPAAQGGGDGRRLLQTLFDALRSAGSPGVHLGVARDNPRAVGFYRHLGFTELDGDDGGLTLGLRL